MTLSTKTVLFLSNEEYLGQFFKMAVKEKDLEFFHYESVAEIAHSFSDLNPNLIVLTQGKSLGELSRIEGFDHRIPVVMIMGPEEKAPDGIEVLKKPITLDMIEELLAKHLLH